MYNFHSLCTKLPALSAICLLLLNPVGAAGIGNHLSNNFVPGEVLVKFKPGYDPASKTRALKKSGSFLKRRLNNDSLEHWKLPANSSVEDTIKQLQASGTVEYAEPNYIRQRMALPNDPLLGYSWALDNTGQVIPSADSNGSPVKLTGVAGMDLQLQQAWNITKGSKDVVIAIHDDGVDLDHPDLQANIWTNPGEIAGDGIDNDKNGYIDDIHGWDVTGNDNNPNPESADYHGTNVAGAAGAVGNNGIGVSGAAWNVSLMPIRTNLSDADSIAGIDYAIANKADIMVTSWGGYEPSRALADAVTRMEQAGILLVAAAGNEQQNNDYVATYPANYTNSNIVAVTASTPEGKPTEWAHIGQTSVDIAAPGVGVFLPMFPGNPLGRDENGNKLQLGSLYGYTDGTSFSTPYVAGVAALLKTRYPQADHRELKARLMAGSRSFHDNWNYLNAGNGHLSALKALQAEAAPVLVVNKIITRDEQGAANNHYIKGQTYTLDITLENLWKTAGNVSATLTTADAFITIETDNTSYGNIANNTLKNQKTLRFSLTEDPGKRPLRFSLSLSADDGYIEKRRFILENIKTIDQALIVISPEGEITDALSPYLLDVLTKKGNLTVPAAYRFVSGIDMTFTQNIAAGSPQLIGWQLSYIPEGARIYSCKGSICNTPLPEISQPPQTGNAIIHVATDGGDFDSDRQRNGRIKSTLVLLQKCAAGQQCDPTTTTPDDNNSPGDTTGDSNDTGDNSSGSGGGGSMNQGWLFLMLLMLLVTGYLRRASTPLSPRATDRTAP